MSEKTYTVKAEWDSGLPSGRGSFVRTSQTEQDVINIRQSLREDAPTGSTHTVRVEAE